MKFLFTEMTKMVSGIKKRKKERKKKKCIMALAKNTLVLARSYQKAGKAYKATYIAFFFFGFKLCNNFLVICIKLYRERLMYVHALYKTKYILIK